LLDNPPEPTARMKKGLKTYEQIVANEVWSATTQMAWSRNVRL
jgi:hypothetical protein